MRIFKNGVILCITCFWAAGAIAQTDENLLLNPWEKSETIEARADGYLFPSASLSNQAGSLKLFEVESAGRLRFDLGYELNPTVGYDLTYLNLEQHRPNPSGPRLPHQLTDLSIGFGSPIVKIGDRGFLAATGALGYSGDEAFADGRGFYGKGSIMYGRELKPGTNLLFILDYNGNRGFLPDVPLPAFAYSSKLDEHLAYVVGFPVNSLLWNPTPRTKVTVNWYIPDSLSVQAAWELDKHIGLFTGYDQRRDIFRAQEIPGDKRLFFHEQRLEAGVRWKTKGLRLEIAGGYAFARSFDDGFDSRNVNRVARMSDEPFVRFSIAFSR